MRYAASHVPIILSIHIYLGACSEPASPTAPSNTVRCFVTAISTEPRWLSFSGRRTFLYAPWFRPVHSQVRQAFLPFSPYIFCRPPAYRSQPPPLETFRLRCITAAITVTLCRLHRASDRISAACRSIRVGISGRYPVILPIELSVL